MKDVKVLSTADADTIKERATLWYAEGYTIAKMAPWGHNNDHMLIIFERESTVDPTQDSHSAFDEDAPKKPRIEPTWG